MPKMISHKELSSTLALTECNTSADYRGAWWLYDKTRGMNLSMGAKSPQDAFVEALTYYQERCHEQQSP